MSSPLVSNKIALVTGAGSGIGRATCQVLEREGARVIAADINFNTAKETINMLKNPSQHQAVEMDVTQKTSITTGISAIIEKYKSPPTLVVNSAGLFNSTPFLSFDVDSDTAIMDVNVKGIFLVNQIAANAMIKHGSDGGSIVNISSIVGKTGGGGNFVQYSTSKGAVTAFTKSISQELISKGIRVNCVMPGIIDTPILSCVDSETKDIGLKLIPLGRMGKPEEVAEVIVFLLSDRSSYMVGANVEITGGLNM